MKKYGIIIIIFFLMNGSPAAAQDKTAVVLSPNHFNAHNREVTYQNGYAYLNRDQPGDGLLWLKDVNFGNGVIELDLKGTNTPGRSFVGFAFHGKDNETFDAVYFRPFNFLNPDRNGHSVQYISMPGNDWQALRQQSPGMYENPVSPIPDPVDDWFHVKIVVDRPNVKVYVNGSSQPTLEVKQLSTRKEGSIGFWTGNGSEGWFRNLTIHEITL